MLLRHIASITCINIIVLYWFSTHTPELNASVQTLPAYIIASKANLLNSTRCGMELQNFQDAVDQRLLWSLKVLDSNGAPKPGFLYGNNYWLGSRSQCLDTMNTDHLQIAEHKILNNALYSDPHRFPPFKINYFVAHIRHNSTLQYHTYIYNEDVITLGFCLPASCTTKNLSFILEKILCDRLIFIDDLYSANFQLIQVKDLKDDIKLLFNGSLSVICVVLALSLMTITGTIYDIFVYQKWIKKSINGDRSKEIETNVNLPSHRESKIGKILICFSVYTNTRKIFNTKLDAGAISVIHGLKLLSMCCIIILHASIYTWDTIDNKVGCFRFQENHIYLFVMSFMQVDTFFFSSGCLVTYTYLRTNGRLKEPANCRKELIKLVTHIIKRFIRLTPAYMIAVGISQLSSAWFDETSQFYVHERSHETCPKYWWRNLLYINNFFRFEDMCLSWSWYLANDMQFYIIAIVVLILSTRYFYVAVTILSTLLIGSTILSGYISYIHEYTLTFDELIRLIDVMYTPPWMRINPYIIGMVTGYILIKLNNNAVSRRKVIVLCWFLASLCIVYVLFVIVIYKRHVSILVSAIYVALHRIFWAIGITGIVIACSTKHGGIVNQFLSLKTWIPLSRLTYCAFLLNPIIIQSIQLYSETPMHFECLSLVVMTAGYITIIFPCSYVLSVMVEIPCTSLINELTVGDYQSAPCRIISSHNNRARSSQ